MEIGIDACCWSNRRGFGRFTRELLTAMAGRTSGCRLVFVCDHVTADESQFPENVEVLRVETRVPPTVAASSQGSRSLRDLWNFSRAVAARRFDAFFFPAVYTYFPLLRKVPVIVTFHDVIAERHPDLVFSNRRARLFWKIKTRLALRQADRLLTVSESARRQIAGKFRRSASSIDVVNEGSAGEFRVIDDPERLGRVRERYGLPAGVPLILYVGGISPHKNLDGLLRALKIVRQSDDRPWQLAVAGDYANDSFLGCYSEIRGLCQELQLADRVTFTGFVPNEDLVSLYNAARLLVLPSFDEGFGLPVVEAMACGLPVAVSNRGSLPEVAGPAGLLFDPQRPREIADSISRLLTDAGLRTGLREAGLRQARWYSWESAAEKVIQLCKETVVASRKAA